MAKLKTVRPTDGELAVLQVLWERGPCTVRQVHEALGRGGVRYTTTLKIMQNMTGKGLLARDTSRGAHVYRASAAEKAVQRRLLADFLDKAFGGSAEKMLAATLAARDLTPEELKKIRSLLEQKGEDHGSAR